MKKILFSAFIALMLGQFSFAQNICDDTVYFYRFIDGSATKTLEYRTIYVGDSIRIGSALYRPYVFQSLINNSWVNTSKQDYVFNNGLLSEESTSDWDTLTNVWKITRQVNYTYDANRNNTGRIEQRLDLNSGTLVNHSKFERLYNSANRETKSNEYNWNVNSNAWVNSTATTTNYQSDTLLTYGLTEMWDTTSNAWINNRLIEGVFNANGKKISATVYLWDLSLNAWRGFDSLTSSYNAQGLLLEQYQFKWDLASSTFVDWRKYIYTYDNNGNLIYTEYKFMVSNVYNTTYTYVYEYNANNVLTSLRSEIWLGNASGIQSVQKRTITLNAEDKPLLVVNADSNASTNNNWLIRNRTTTTYNASGLLTSQLYEQTLNSSDSILRNSTRVTRTYDNNNYELTYLTEIWNISNGSWTPSSSQLFEYNNEGYLTARDFKNSWDTINNYFSNHTRQEYLCSETVGIEDELNAEESRFNVYPNPVTKGIPLNIYSSQSTNYQLFDYFGRLIQSGKSSEGMNTLSTDNLSTGMYILILDTNAYKVIVQ